MPDAGMSAAAADRGVSDYTWGAAVAVVLCGLAPVWLLASTANQPSSPVWPAALLVVELAGGSYSYAVGAASAGCSS